MKVNAASHLKAWPNLRLLPHVSTSRAFNNKNTDTENKIQVKMDNHLGRFRRTNATNHAPSTVDKNDAKHLKTSNAMSAETSDNF